MAVFNMTGRGTSTPGGGGAKTYVVSKITNPVFNTQDASLNLTGSFTDISGNTHSVADLNQGDTIYIIETGAPDRWCGEKQIPIPSGYTQLAYLQSSGTQYIDTGIKPDAVYAVELDTMVLETPGNWGCLFGSQGNWMSGSNSLLITYSSYFRFRCGSGSNEINMQSFALNCRYNMYCDKSMEFKVDGVSQGTNTAGDTNSTYNIYIFANNSEGSAMQYTKQKLYGATMYASNNTLLRNFIPAKRDSDDALGLYDTVSGTFFTNAGTGTFTAGPAVQGIVLYSIEASTDLSAYRTAVAQDVIDAGKVSTTDYSPYTKTSAMTQIVGKDSSGKLWTTPGGGGGGSSITILTQAEFDALSPKPTSGLIGIRQVYKVHSLYDMAYYTEDMLLYSDQTKILVNARAETYVDYAATWGTLSILDNANAQKENGAVMFRGTSMAKYDLGADDTSCTIYCVMKECTPAGGDHPLFCAAYYPSYGQAPNFYHRSGDLRTSVWGNADTSTGRNGYVYNVMTISINNTTKKARFYLNGAYNCEKDFSNSSRYIRYSGYYNDEHTVDGAVLFAGLVEDAESDSIILNNQQDLIRKYNVT